MASWDPEIEIEIEGTRKFLDSVLLKLQKK
jgi:hypothetical protein